jgi:transforming growth factor-beta-induced protein
MTNNTTIALSGQNLPSMPTTPSSMKTVAPSIHPSVPIPVSIVTRTQTPTPILSPTSTRVPTEPPQSPGPKKNIMETAEEDGRFTTLVAAMKTTGLDETLKEDTLNYTQNFTVFAPTDDAFMNLPPGTLDTLFNDPQGDLLQILLYHVVSGKMKAADLKRLPPVETLQGVALSISTSRGIVTVNGANITISDIECSNGVIQGIDTVMIPPTEKIPGS